MVPRVSRVWYSKCLLLLWGSNVVFATISYVSTINKQLTCYYMWMTSYSLLLQPHLRRNLMSRLSAEFVIKDFGQLSYFLCIVISRTLGGLFPWQQWYAQEILSQTKMSDCNPVHTPIDTTSKECANFGPIWWSYFLSQ